MDITAADSKALNGIAGKNAERARTYQKKAFTQALGTALDAPAEDCHVYLSDVQVGDLLAVHHHGMSYWAMQKPLADQLHSLRFAVVVGRTAARIKVRDVISPSYGPYAPEEWVHGEAEQWGAKEGRELFRLGNADEVFARMHALKNYRLYVENYHRYIEAQGEVERRAAEDRQRQADLSKPVTEQVNSLNQIVGYNLFSAESVYVWQSGYNPRPPKIIRNDYGTLSKITDPVLHISVVMGRWAMGTITRPQRDRAVRAIDALFKSEPVESVFEVEPEYDDYDDSEV